MTSPLGDSALAAQGLHGAKNGVLERGSNGGVIYNNGASIMPDKSGTGGRTLSSPYGSGSVQQVAPESRQPATFGSGNQKQSSVDFFREAAMRQGTSNAYFDAKGNARQQLPGQQNAANANAAGTAAQAMKPAMQQAAGGAGGAMGAGAAGGGAGAAGAAAAAAVNAGMSGGGGGGAPAAAGGAGGAAAGGSAPAGGSAAAGGGGGGDAASGGGAGGTIKKGGKR